MMLEIAMARTQGSLGACDNMENVELIRSSSDSETEVADTDFNIEVVIISGTENAVDADVAEWTSEEPLDRGAL